jgi:hypothetical protein
VYPIHFSGNWWSTKVREGVADGFTNCLSNLPIIECSSLNDPVFRDAVHDVNRAVTLLWLSAMFLASTVFSSNKIEIGGVIFGHRRQVTN